MSESSVRADAAVILAKLQQDRIALPSLLDEHRDDKEFSLLQELTFGVCRWYHQLDYLLGLLLDKPVRNKDRDLHFLLLVGLYQLKFLSIPDHAALNETVAATEQLQKPWARGLVNAVLRNYLRRQEDLSARVEAADPAVRYSHPGWLCDAIQRQWPEQALQIMQANNSRPPLCLRTNQRHGNREEYLQRLLAAGIPARAGSLAPTSIYLEAPMPVSQIPGFESGAASVQDEASQLVPGLLDLAPGLRVLDACAAPGSKTAHLLESERLLTSCVAIDMDPRRIARIHENLSRLSLQAEVKLADALNTESWWDGEAFDRILLDAPCTAIGVIRRHPDIKLLRSADSLGSQPRLQGQLLDKLWPTLKPGGLLLYTTCSILREENENSIAAFVASHDNVKYESITADWGVECAYGRQLLPASGLGTDGFYFCLLRKT